ncbi:hypothetical protein M5K25_019825 [Dendrobium thyrsiflorum]|uniref:CG-1 domain-containing protein n=1 Tax=Dendrobium thyrsiflorum TaxID=117978 RepID=A0ABD0UG09_DENTH
MKTLMPSLQHAIYFINVAPLQTFMLVACQDIHGDMRQILAEAKSRWLRPTEISAILRNYHRFNITPDPPNLPPGRRSVTGRRLVSMWVVREVDRFAGLSEWARWRVGVEFLRWKRWSGNFVREVVQGVNGLGLLTSS